MKASDFVAANPNVEHFSTFLGATSSFGRIAVKLRPRSQRKATPEQVKSRNFALRWRASPGSQHFFTNPPLVRIGGQNSRSLYQVTLQAADLPTLYRASADFERRMHDIPGLEDTNERSARSPVPK